MANKSDLSVTQLLTNTREDEDIFILCSRDICAPAGVAAWIAEARRLGVDHEKIREAELCEIRMRTQGRKLPN